MSGQTADTEATRTAFFYGTLPQMEPQVFFRVCYYTKDPSDDIKARHTFRPAMLHDYCRHRVKYADYPGMIEEPGQTVFGMVVDGVTKDNLERLDQFEGSQYDRRVVRPRLLIKGGDDTSEREREGEQIITESYIFIDRDDLELRPWDFEEFKREKLHLWTRSGYGEDDDPNDKASASAAV